MNKFDDLFDYNKSKNTTRTDVIKSLEYDQDVIIRNIMDLCDITQFDADITYATGKFYKNLPQPKLKFDIDPQTPDTTQASSNNLPVADTSLNSIMFDPPFLTYVRSGRSGNGNMIMANRFSGYWTYNELEDHYKSTIQECARVLNKKGILVLKCQDIIHNHTMHSTHINVTQWMQPWFRLKDLFVLGAKNRMPIPPKKGENKKKQKHARIYHSYFMVLEKVQDYNG